MPDAPDDCVPDPDSEPAMVQDLERVEAGGRSAWDASELFGGHAVFVQVEGELVVVVGTPAGAEGVRAVAANVEVGPAGPTVPADGLPDGSRPLGTVPLLAVLGPHGGALGPIGAFDPAATWSLWYERGAATEMAAMVAVVVRTGGPLQRELATLVADETQRVSVRGHDGVLTRVALPQQVRPADWWSLRWEERPGEVVEVLAAVAGDTEDGRAVVERAEDLVPVASDEVDDLRLRVAERGLDDPEVTVLGRGTGSDGSPWLLVHGAAGSQIGLASGIDLRLGSTVSRFSASTGGSGEVIEDEGESSGESQGEAEGSVEDVPPAPLRGEWAVVDTEGATWAFGPAGAEVAAVVVRDADDVLVAEAEVYEVEGIKAWLAELPPMVRDEDGMADELVVVALDADGDEVDRQTL
jgi:hypothetical protein